MQSTQVCSILEFVCVQYHSRAPSMHSQVARVSHASAQTRTHEYSNMYSRVVNMHTHSTHNQHARSVIWNAVRNKNIMHTVRPT